MDELNETAVRDTNVPSKSAIPLAYLSPSTEPPGAGRGGETIAATVLSWGWCLIFGLLVARVAEQPFVLTLCVIAMFLPFVGVLAKSISDLRSWRRERRTGFDLGLSIVALVAVGMPLFALAATFIMLILGR